MDIACPNCGEPWDATHMLEDEPHEWGLDMWMLERILEERKFRGPDDPARKLAAACGWEFAGDSLLTFVRCPACKHKEEGILRQRVREQAAKRQVLESLLAGDEDGLLSELAE